MHMQSHAQLAASLRTRVTMIACLIPLVALTIVGLFALWPGGAQETLPTDDPTAQMDKGAKHTVATVTAVDSSACEPDTTDPAQLADCTTFQAEADGDTGSLYVTPDAFQAGVNAGDEVKVIDFSNSPDKANTGTDYIFIDYDRDVPILALAIIYGIVVLAVAGLRGFRAILGLGFAGLVLLAFMFPAILGGKPPVLVAMVSASAIMMIALYLAHGISTRTTTAMFGTILGIILTGVLGAWMTSWANLGIAYTEDGFILADSTNLAMDDLIVCAILITGLGVLNDVTITQVSAVWELAAVAPDLRGRHLFARAMRIGRDHIASTVYTITFAYAGSALMTLLIFSANDQSFFETLTLGEMSIEVVSILVCSIGLVIAIPLTTALGVLVVRPGAQRPSRSTFASQRTAARH
ncbi:YibE/F family protein [Brevibacterium aurantiacum]|uniref:YibE/F family protein n=1 Tax=Brevibacterium aurantiacum TaxID=273384 RepID=A0A556CAV4_BREAU|nr:YibE/F family protein [Brevibacterium aurantiacum]TSI14567.1 YibE/F family protein [Brevibacterium aurantiacum]